MITTPPKSTKTKSFILPLTFFPISYYSLVVNAYLKDEENIDLKEKVFVVLEDGEKQKEVLDICKTFDTFYGYYKISDFIVIILNLKPVFKEDLKHFLDGNYSKFSTLAKNIILNTYGDEIEKRGKKVKSNIYKVLKPDDEDISKLEEEIGSNLHKREVFSKPRICDETLTLNKLIKLTQ